MLYANYCGLIICCICIGCSKNTHYSEISAEKAQLHQVFGELISVGLSTNEFDGNIAWCQEQLISAKPRALNSMIASNKTFYVNPNNILWYQAVTAWRTNGIESPVVLATHFSNEVAVCSPVPRVDSWTGSRTFMAVSFADTGLILTNMPPWAESRLANTNATP